MEVIGFLDSIKKNTVTGWATAAFDGKPMEIEIVVGNNRKKIIADRYRQGLKDKNLHSTGNCAFAADISELLPTDKREVLIQVFAGDKELKGSPVNYSPELKESIKNKIALIHIPKTAGTSINYLFEEEYGKENVITHLESDQQKKDSGILSNYDFVSGHLNYGEMSAYASSNFRLAVVLRDPLDQLISHINWVRDISNDVSSKFFQEHPDPVKKLSLQLRELDFEDQKEVKSFFANLKSPGLSLFDNCQTRYLLGNYKSDNECVTEHDFELASTNLKQIDLIGFTEQLPSLVQQLNSSLGIKLSRNIERKNVRSGKSVLPEKEVCRTLFDDFLKQDCKILEVAKNIAATHKASRNL